MNKKSLWYYHSGTTHNLTRDQETKDQKLESLPLLGSLTSMITNSSLNIFPPFKINWNSKLIFQKNREIWIGMWKEDVISWMIFSQCKMCGNIFTTGFYVLRIVGAPSLGDEFQHVYMWSPCYRTSNYNWTFWFFFTAISLVFMIHRVLSFFHGSFF